MESTNNSPNPTVDQFAAELGANTRRPHVKDAKSLGREIKAEIIRQGYDNAEEFCRKHPSVGTGTISRIINGGLKRVTPTLTQVIATLNLHKPQQ